MRTLRPALAGLLILALLGGPSAAATAQEASEEDVGATHVMGTMTTARTVEAPTITMDMPHNTGRGAVYEHEIDWSDPRLPSLMRSAENWEYYYVGDLDGAISIVRTVRLEGPEGAWTGTEYALLKEDGEELGDEGHYPGTWLMLLTGEGTYAGLSAMLTRTYADYPPAGDEAWVGATFEGYIFEGGLAPAPEPSGPPAE